MNEHDPQVRRVGPGEVIIHPEQIERFKGKMAPHFKLMKKFHNALVAVQPDKAAKERINVRMTLNGQAEATEGDFIGRAATEVEFREMMGYRGSTVESIQRQAYLPPQTPLIFESITFFTHKHRENEPVKIGGEARGLSSQIVNGHSSYEVYLIEDVEQAEIGVMDLEAEVRVSGSTSIDCPSVVLAKPIVDISSNALQPIPAMG